MSESQASEARVDADPTPEAAAEPAAHGGGRSGERSGGHALLVREGDIAADYLEALLDIADLDGDIDMDVANGRAMVSVVGDALDDLVGSRGEVLEALQDLTRLAVQQQTGERSRLMLDIGGWREQRRAQLADLGRATAEQVKERGTPQSLQPMTPFERKVVHDAVAEVDGVISESEGEDPGRYVVVSPA